jgi:hypothetical protein
MNDMLLHSSTCRTVSQNIFYKSPSFTCSVIVTEKGLKHRMLKPLDRKPHVLFDHVLSIAVLSSGSALLSVFTLRSHRYAYEVVRQSWSLLDDFCMTLCLW